MRVFLFVVVLCLLFVVVVVFVFALICPHLNKTVCTGATE